MKRRATVITAICVVLVVIITVCMSACAKRPDNSTGAKISSTTEDSRTQNEFSAEVYPGSFVVFNKSTRTMTVNSMGVLPWSNWNVQVAELFENNDCSLDDVKRAVITEGVTVFDIGDFCAYKNLTEITIPRSAKAIAGVANFNNPYSHPSQFPFRYFNINKINYGGTEKDWKKIRTDAEIDTKKCSINYSVSVPQCSGFEKTKLNNEIISDTVPNTNIVCTANLATGKLTVKGDGKLEQQDQLFYNLADFLTVMYNDDQSLIAVGSYVDWIVIEEGITELGTSVIGIDNLNKITLPRSLKAIGKDNFTSKKAVKNIFYSSTESDWNKVKINSGNDGLGKANIHYN